MANTLTSLVPDLYEAIDIVSRELSGFIPSCTLLASADRAAINQSIRIPIAPASTAEDVVPGSIPPDDGDQVITNNPLVITKSRMVPFRWTGEEQKGVNTGPGYKNLRRDQIAQAVRTLVNEIEVAMGGLITTTSRAYGTAGTTPFSSDLSDTAQMRKILSDNGAPLGDLNLVIDTAAGAKVRSLAQLTKANEAGTKLLREQGVLLDIHGFTLRESMGVNSHTAGTGSGYKINASTAVAKGDTTWNLDTGTGTILAGDFITTATDTNKYVVSSALSAGALKVGAPGALKAEPVGTNVTVGGSYTGNMAFARTAIVLATRAPALPEEGDMADDRMLITDPRTGLTFEVAMYLQYRRVRYEISIAYGFANIKPEHTAILLG